MGDDDLDRADGWGSGKEGQTIPGTLQGINLLNLVTYKSKGRSSESGIFRIDVNL